MGAPAINFEQILVFIFVFLRIGAMLIMIPVFGEASVPLRVKGGLTILIALLVSPSIHTDITFLNTEGEIIALVIAMVGEILIGIIIGFAAKIIFAGIQFAGDTIGVQMGFSIVNVLDPVSNAQISIISEFQYLVAVLVYLAIDAHHMFIYAIVDSYRTIPAFGYHFSASLMQSIITFSKGLFLTAIKVSAPIMAVLLFTNVALGVVARTVPQINIFAVGFPLQIAIGLFFFGLMIPLFVMLTQSTVAGLGIEIQTLLRLM